MYNFFYILIKILLTFVSNIPMNNNKPALVQIIAWHCAGDKPLSEAMVANTYALLTLDS